MYFCINTSVLRMVLYKSKIRYIMKKIMPHNDKNIKQLRLIKQTSEQSFLKMSKSEIFTGKKHKKSISIEKQHKQMSKNDLKLPIYTDKQGFIVQYSILSYGLKCECSISENVGKKNNKTGCTGNLLGRQNSIKRNIKLQITLGKHHVAVIKAGVKHIFPLPQEPKHNFLKIALIENWQIQQFNVPNKKIKICDGQILSASLKGYDQIQVLTKIAEADELRKLKLTKSQSKVKISWCNTPRESLNFSRNNEVFSFFSQKQYSQMSKSMIIQSEKSILSSAFLRKSFNQNDQTRDSQEESICDERHFEKKQSKILIKTHKTLCINTSLWSQEYKVKQAHEIEGKTDDTFPHHQKKTRKNSNY